MDDIAHLDCQGETDVSPQEWAAWSARTSYGKLLALLASGTRDIAAAEDALGDAFERALAIWPQDGVPGNPEGWLLTVARNRLRDQWKTAATQRIIPLDPDRHIPVYLETVDPEAIGDHRLELMLVCAHPAIDPAMRMPLMLNTVLGFTAAQIAVALALPATTVAGRLVRVKRRIKEACIAFEIPERTALPGRLHHVLDAVYGAFAINWRISGNRLRSTLDREALHLAETTAQLAPQNAEAHGLAALICLSMARAPARLDDEARFIPLAEQDPASWDRGLIERGREHLRIAHSRGELGRYQLEAAVQAVHCARVEAGTTNWAVLRDLHRHLHAQFPSLGASTALAAVIAETDGPDAGLMFLDNLGKEGERFQPAWATRAHLLQQLGRNDEAIAAYDKAISLTTDLSERDHLQRMRNTFT